MTHAQEGANYMTNPEWQNIMGSTAVDRDGDKIGKIGQIYLDDASGQPQWVTISTGLFGTKESFAPISGYRLDGDNVVLNVSKDQVKDAPNVDADGHLDDAENDRLYAYYDASFGTATDTPAGGKADYADTSYGSGSGDVTDANNVAGADTVSHDHTDHDHDHADHDHDHGAVGHDTSGPNTDDAMTRSEEQLTVGTQQVETGRARLRKYVVTEDVTTTVPVSREEVRLEREPITEDNRDAALSGGDITEEEHEVTLHAEQPVVQKETVPVERVRLNTETVTENQQVTEQVRKEQIDTPDVTGR
jgi:uncharacterized protein (TIGR02271 family)